MKKIMSVSRKFRIFFQILFYLAPIMTLAFWLVPLFITPQQTLSLIPHIPFGKLSWLAVCMAMAVNLFITAISMTGLYCLIRLFKNYEVGKIFHIENVVYYRRLGFTLFAWFLGTLLSEPLYAMIYSHGHAIKIGVTAQDFLAPICGGIIILIAWIMDEGYKLSQEQEYTV